MKYKLLKKNAPLIWEKFYSLRKEKLSKRLNDMRQLWRVEKKKEKKEELEKVGKNIKNELKILDLTNTN